MQKLQKRHLITAGCLLAAIGFYAAPTSAVAFLLLGAAFEGAFWGRLLRKARQP